MKKIGIVTIFDALNYGAFFQVFAMQKYLESIVKDAEVNVLNCFHPEIVRYKCLVCRPSRFKNRIKMFRSFQKDKKELNIKKYRGEKYDLVFLGSDEIWNISNNSFIHLPEYFGENINANRIIAYAPSCGYTKPEIIYNQERYQKAIKNIDAIYARDEYSKMVAEKVRNEKCEMVTDPTFLYWKNWENEVEPMELPDEKFLLYYSYNGKLQQTEWIKKYARENNLKIYVVGFSYDWADRSLLVNPKQFLFLMKKAEVVVTTTFHGTIFSNIFQKRYITLHGNPKTQDVLKKLGAFEEQYLLEEGTYEDLKEKLDRRPNYDKINENLEKLIAKSQKIVKEEVKMIGE